MKADKPGTDIKLSIVIPHLSGWEILRECLQSLKLQTTQEFETILVDNACLDGSVDKATNRFPEIKVIRLQENRGFAGGANAGAQKAQGELLAFINDDVTLDPGWTQAVIKGMKQHPKAGAAATLLNMASDRDIISSAGNFLLPSGFGRDRGIGKSALNGYLVHGEVFWASGGAGVIRRWIFEQLGGFDEDFFAYYEDTDLGMRARLAGFFCVYLPQARGIHRGGASGGACSPLCIRNAVYTVIKCFPLPVLLRHLPNIIWSHLKGLAFLIYQGQGNWIWRIEFDLIRKLPQKLKVRRQIQRNRRMFPKQVEDLLQNSPT